MEGKDMKEIRTRKITLTPEWAAQLLAGNVNIRRTSQQTVARLATAIINGDWRLTHQGIATDENGRLVDGFHRCAAVVAAGRRVEILLTEGLDHEALTRVDTGIKRSAGFYLAHQGIANSSAAAAAARLLHAYRLAVITGQSISTCNSVYTTTDDILRTVSDSDPGLLEWVAPGKTMALRTTARIRPSVLSAACYLTGTERPESARHLYSGLTEGVGLTAGDPVLTLARWRPGHRADLVQQIRVTFRVARAVIDGERLHKLCFRSDMPLPVVGRGLVEAVLP